MALVYITTPLDLTGIHSWHCISYFFLMMKKLGVKMGGTGKFQSLFCDFKGGGGGGGWQPYILQIFANTNVA